VLAGPLAEERVAWRLDLPRPRRDDPRELRVGTWLDDPACPVDREVRTLLEQAAAALRASGVQVDDGRPELDLFSTVRTYLQLLMPIIVADFPRETFDGLVAAAESAPPDADDPVTRTARFGTIRHRDWLAASEERERVRARMSDFFKSHDALLMPVVPVAAIPHDTEAPLPARTITVNGEKRSYHDLLSWISLATMAYLPATVVPVGRTPGGLPVGIQIVGPYLEDRTTIAIAKHLASVTGGFEPPPGY
jgi:amidase